MDFKTSPTIEELAKVEFKPRSEDIIVTVRPELVKTEGSNYNLVLTAQGYFAIKGDLWFPGISDSPYLLTAGFDYSGAWFLGMQKEGSPELVKYKPQELIRKMLDEAISGSEKKVRRLAKKEDLADKLTPFAFNTIVSQVVQDSDFDNEYEFRVATLRQLHTSSIPKARTLYQTMYKEALDKSDIGALERRVYHLGESSNAKTLIRNV
jgi:hypothetical protein